MHHYDEILANIQAAENNLQQAISVVNANRGRGVDNKDALRIVEVRKAVHKEYEWFKECFDNSI